MNGAFKYEWLFRNIYRRRQNGCPGRNRIQRRLTQGIPQIIIAVQCILPGTKSPAKQQRTG
jgi:hypothetical protein